MMDIDKKMRDIDKLIFFMFTIYGVDDFKEIDKSGYFSVKTKTLYDSNRYYIKTGTGTISPKRIYDVYRFVKLRIMGPLLEYWLKRDLFSLIDNEYYKELINDDDNEININIDLSKLNFDCFPKEMKEALEVMLKHGYDKDLCQEVILARVSPRNVWMGKAVHNYVKQQSVYNKPSLFKYFKPFKFSDDDWKEILEEIEKGLKDE